MKDRDLILVTIATLSAASVVARLRVHAARGRALRAQAGSRAVVHGDSEMEAIAWSLVEDDLQVGDYHREYVFLLHPTGIYQVKLEGWGQDCVPGKGPRAAYTQAARLAKEWSQERWFSTGWFKVDDRDVWAMTWAVQGPLDALPDDVDENDPEMVIDHRPAGSAARVLSSRSPALLATWPESVLPVGTTLYHGSNRLHGGTVPRGPAWFALDARDAQDFGSTVHAFATIGPYRLALVDSYERAGVHFGVPRSARDLSRTPATRVLLAGYDGYHYRHPLIAGEEVVLGDTGRVRAVATGSPSIVRGPYERTQSTPSGTWPRWETDPDAFGRTPNLREVAPDLYVGASTAVLTPPGSFWNPGQAKPLNDAEYGIVTGWDTILCLNWSEPDLGLREALGGPPPALRAGYGAARIWWCSSFIDGNRVPAHVLDDALSLWAHREGPMLIHRHWGLSRSASIAAALLRLKFGLSQDTALERVRLPGVPLSDWPRVRTFDSAMRLVDEMLQTRKDAV